MTVINMVSSENTLSCGRGNGIGFLDVKDKNILKREVKMGDMVRT